MSKGKFTGNISGKGYYIALILCAFAIGISGYVYYRSNQEKTADVTQADTAVYAPAEDVPAAVTQPKEPATRPTVPQQETEPTKAVPGKRVSPVSGEVIGEYAVECLSYNQTTRDWRTHDGVDFAAAAGTTVCAAADGEVYSVYEDETMGFTVVIVHDGGYTTRYCSLSEEVAVRPGDRVIAGQTIGYVGATALLESVLGEHLHFAVSCSGESQDPLAFLAGN